VSGQGRPDLAIVDAEGLTLAIAGTRWHAEITDSLVARAAAAAAACGVRDFLVVRVAGAVELPVIAAELAKRYDAVACLGAVIRGGTPHFEYVCDAVTAGLTRVALDSGKPIGNGVLTCNTVQEARDRCGLPKAPDFKGSSEDSVFEGTVSEDSVSEDSVSEDSVSEDSVSEDKGWEAVVAALDTAILLRAIRSGSLTGHTARH